MTLIEALKKPFISDAPDVPQQNISNEPDIIQTTKILSDDPVGGAMVVNNDYQHDPYNFGALSGEDKFIHQNRIIQSYRVLASDSEVSRAVDIICDEVVFTTDDDVFKLDIDEENEQITEAISNSFKKVKNVLNIRENMYNIVRQMYIDGQLNVSLGYDTKKTKEGPGIKKGIVTAKILEPMNLYFDPDIRIWKYKESQEINSLYTTELLKNDIEFTESELVHIDYGLYSKVLKDNELPYQVNLSYLENAFKNAAMLQTLENMLVPARYSRSVSRRLFNIDVADLPPKQAKALMDKIRAEFRYKRSYDPATGSIKNMNATQPLVEDYWMSNRGGAKGTTVDTMDERGGLLDMDDIMYAAKKLYGSMKVPDSRNPYSDDQAEFSWDATSVTQEELSFYIFIDRIRIPVCKLMKEILRRELVSTGVFMDSEWKGYEEKISVEFTAKSIFLENMEKMQFQQNVEAFGEIKENIGTTISLASAVDKTMSWSSDQLQEELELITKEKLNPLYKPFYASNQEEDGGAW